MKKNLSIVLALVFAIAGGYFWGAYDTDEIKSEVIEAKSTPETKMVTVKVGETIVRDNVRGDFYLIGLSEEHFVIASGRNTETIVTFEYPIQMIEEFTIRGTDIVLKPIHIELVKGTVKFKVTK